jgi:hypothetical protein
MIKNNSFFLFYILFEYKFEALIQKNLNFIHT